MMLDGDPFTPKQAWVVFQNDTELVPLRMLRRGFRHCWILMLADTPHGEVWLSIDPMAHSHEIQIHALPTDFELPRWLIARGNTVVRAVIRPAPKRPAPLGLMSCVETCKRIIGIHALFIQTPHQLYKYLRKEDLK